VEERDTWEGGSVEIEVGVEEPATGKRRLDDNDDDDVAESGKKLIGEGAVIDEEDEDEKDDREDEERAWLASNELTLCVEEGADGCHPAKEEGATAGGWFMGAGACVKVGADTAEVKLNKLDEDEGGNTVGARVAGTW
jgi:hypothetical protein